MILNGREIIIDDVEVDAFRNSEETDVIIIQWAGNIGFGEYMLYRDKGRDKWVGESECMDSKDDKQFIRLLMDKFIEDLEVVG